jgi:phosphoribosylformylglycinamidine (FGAM) synthase-like amidotransferase family enzyme
MPHPERMVDPEANGTDGQSFFTAIVERMAGV